MNLKYRFEKYRKVISNSEKAEKLVSLNVNLQTLNYIFDVYMLKKDILVYLSRKISTVKIIFYR